MYADVSFFRGRYEKTPIPLPLFYSRRAGTVVRVRRADRHRLRRLSGQRSLRLYQLAENAGAAGGKFFGKTLKKHAVSGIIMTDTDPRFQNRNDG